MLRRFGSSVESGENNHDSAQRGGFNTIKFKKKLKILTKQRQEGLESKVHVASAGLLPGLQHHLLLTDLTQVEA